mgnify:CR=1 FL=1
MKPLSFQYQFFDLPLRHVFAISRYSVAVQTTVIVRIGDGECFGYGEATLNPFYGSTREKLTQSLNSLQQVVQTSELIHPETLWERLKSRVSDDNFALSAVDCAYWDFYARKNNRTLRSYWSTGAEPLPVTSFTIGIASVAEMTKKIEEQPWPLFKN